MDNGRIVADIRKELDLEILESFSNFNNNRNDTRYYVAKVLHQGQVEFLKVALHDDLKQKLEAEATWAEFFNSHAQNKTVAAPQVLRKGDNYMLSEWIDAPLLGRIELTESSSTEIDGLIKILQALLDLPGKQFTITQKQGWRQRDIEDSIRQKAAKLTGYAAINKSELAQIIDLTHKYYPRQSMGLSHGDFTPWHVFSDESRLVLFDGEHASSRLPILKDTANGFVKIFANRQKPDGVGRLLAEVQQHTGLSNEQFTAQITPSLLKWIIIALLNIQADTRNGEKNLVSIEKVKSLLEMALSEDLEQLKAV